MTQKNSWSPLTSETSPEDSAAFLGSDEKLERNHRGGKQDGARLERHQTRREGQRKITSGKEVVKGESWKEEEKVEGEREED